MTPDKPVYRQWWGYQRRDSEIVLRDYRGNVEIREACDNESILHVRGPFIASAAAAMGILKAKIALARSKASMKRLLAASPQKLLTYDPA